MNTTQISRSVESHTEEPLWQELTEEEQEKIGGGIQLGFPFLPSRTGNWREDVKWKLWAPVGGSGRSGWYHRHVYNHRTREWGHDFQWRG